MSRVEIKSVTYTSGMTVYANSGAAFVFKSGSTTDFQPGSIVDFTGATVTGIAGGSIDDGDKVDVLVSGSGTVFTVQGATDAMFVYPTAPMAALVIDVDKLNNTKSIAADTTFTLGSHEDPEVPTSGARFGLKLTNTDTAVHTITLPVGVTFKSDSRGGATITTFVMPASSTLTFTFEQEAASTWRMFGEPITTNDLSTKTVPIPADSVGIYDSVAGVDKKVVLSTLPSFAVKKTVSTGSYTIGTTNGNELYGGVIYCTGDCTLVIPAVNDNILFTVIARGAGVNVTIDPNGSDLLDFNGTPLADGTAIVSDGTTGAMAVITSLGDGTGFFAATDPSWASE